MDQEEVQSAMKWLTDYKVVLPLIGVVVGALLTGVLTLVRDWLSNRRESKKLAFAFRGEINALAEIANRRRYIENLSQAIELLKNLKNNEQLPEKYEEELQYNIYVRLENFQVYRANARNIGILKFPLPEMVARYYVQANSILEDFQCFTEGHLRGKPVWVYVRRYTQLLDLMENTRTLAEDIVQKVDTSYM
jgi:hypothetical protein